MQKYLCLESALPPGIIHTYIGREGSEIPFNNGWEACRLVNSIKCSTLVFYTWKSTFLIVVVVIIIIIPVAVHA